MEDIDQPDDTITFVLRKTFFYGALGLIIGFGVGFGVSQVFFDSTSGDKSISISESTARLLLEQASSASSPVPSQTPSGATVPQPSTAVQIPIDGRPYFGPENASVVMVEFTDYQCPFCARHFRETQPSILSEFEGRIKYVVFNYPLSSIHPFSQKAAEAAECAYDQGEFWEYHDTLFQNQQALDTVSLKQHASNLGLDSDAFDSCLDSGEKARQVLDDVQLGQGLGVTGTPTFFVDGRQLTGAQPFSNFKTLIDAAIAR